MSKRTLMILVGAALLFSAPAFAIDGQILINQSTVLAAGGFPYRITQPGSYKLSGNLVVPASADGIDILVGNVSIDLDGFTISGPVTCTGSGATISCGAPPNTFGIVTRFVDENNITVRNGTVVGFEIGIVLSTGVNYLVEETHTSANTAYGMQVEHGVVRRNTASLNGFYGILAAFSTVTENVASSNGIAGLNLGGGVYGSNTIDGNGGVPVATFPPTPVSQGNNYCFGSVPC
jgi:hypothetical protein